MFRVRVRLRLLNKFQGQGWTHFSKPTIKFFVLKISRIFFIERKNCINLCKKIRVSDHKNCWINKILVLKTKCFTFQFYCQSKNKLAFAIGVEILIFIILGLIHTLAGHPTTHKMGWMAVGPLNSISRNQLFRLNFSSQLKSWAEIQLTINRVEY